MFSPDDCPDEAEPSLIRVRPTPCSAACVSGPVCCCLLASSDPTHSYALHTHTHTPNPLSTRRLLSQIPLAPGTCPPGGGVEGLWVGGQLFWQAYRSPASTRRRLSEAALPSARGLPWKRLSVALRPRLLIGNRCPIPEPANDGRGRAGLRGM